MYIHSTYRSPGNLAYAPQDRSDDPKSGFDTAVASIVEPKPARGDALRNAHDAMLSFINSQTTQQNDDGTYPKSPRAATDALRYYIEAGWGYGIQPFTQEQWVKVTPEEDAKNAGKWYCNSRSL